MTWIFLTSPGGHRQARIVPRSPSTPEKRQLDNRPMETQSDQRAIFCQRNCSFTKEKICVMNKESVQRYCFVCGRLFGIVLSQKEPT